MVSRLLESEARWIHALLVLSTVTVALVLLNLVAGYLQYFSDVLLTLFSAWLFAFILSPVVGAILHRVPALPRVVVVVVVYGALFIVLSAIVLVFAATAANNVSNFIVELPNLLATLPATLAPWQQRLDDFGLS